MHCQDGPAVLERNKSIPEVRRQAEIIEIVSHFLVRSFQNGLDGEGGM